MCKIKEKEKENYSINLESQDEGQLTLEKGGKELRLVCREKKRVIK